MLSNLARLLCVLLCIFGLSGCSAAIAPAQSSTKPGTTETGSPALEEQAKRAETAERATWTPGQLEAHFTRHGREGPYATTAEYDRAAREVILTGTAFTYVDRESRATRLGYYDARSNRFTSVTADARRITTFFHPDQRERYVRNLERSSYR